eukprot:SAG31_NODE_4297_length_3373_cov_3.080941_3_plen_69_part_00
MDGGGSSSDSEEGGAAFPVQLVTSDDRGRDYVASRDVAADELVLRVAPVAVRAVTFSFLCNYSRNTGL